MQILLWIMTLGVLFVNGWTDAPNAIAAAISTGALSMRKGILLAAVMNALGGCAAMILGQKVAETVFYLGDFSPDAAGTAALAAAANSSGSLAPENQPLAYIRMLSRTRPPSIS